MLPIPSPLRSTAAVAAVALFTVACGETPLDPGLQVEPSLSVLPGVCPASPDVVVYDDGALFDAVADAEPGDVIGIHGLIEIDESVTLETDGVTLTCATAGSGLVATEGSGEDLVRVTAPDVTIEWLVLDATEGRRAVWARNDGESEAATALSLQYNDVRCGTGCTLFIGVQDATIAWNRFVAPHSVQTGVHIQGHGPFAEDGSRPRTIDGTRVFGNEIIAEDESIHQFFGGIRLRDGRDVIAAQNRVIGPWQNSISVDDLSQSHIKQNVLVDPVQYGLVMGLSSFVVASVRDNVFSVNSITGALEIGIWVVSGCGNLFLHNQLVNNGTDGIDGIRFSSETGANRYIGDPGVIDAETGEYDCDGDGYDDPNIIGPGS